MTKENSDPSLAAYWRGLNRKGKDALAAEAGTSAEYLRQVFLYGRKPGALTARLLSNKTGIPAASFRPDVFGEA